MPNVTTPKAMSINLLLHLLVKNQEVLLLGQVAKSRIWQYSFKKPTTQETCIKVINIYRAGNIHIRQARCHLSK